MLLNQTSEDEAVVVVVVEAAEVVAPSVSTPAFMVLSVSSNEPRRNDRMNRMLEKRTDSRLQILCKAPCNTTTFHISTLEFLVHFIRKKVVKDPVKL